MTFLYLAIEDELSAAVGVRLIRSHWGEQTAIHELGLTGSGYLKKRFKSFNQMGRQNVVILITDLDQKDCAPSLIADWSKGQSISAGFVVRVAVREIEAWVMADRSGLAKYLGVSEATIPRDPEIITDPKENLIHISKRAKKQLRQAISPDAGSNAKQGLGYNKALKPFVENHWSIQRAIKNSDSLKRADLRLKHVNRSFGTMQGIAQ